MLSHDLQLHVSGISSLMIKLFRSAHQQCVDHLEEGKKLKQKTDGERNAKLITADIAKMKTNSWLKLLRKWKGNLMSA